MKRTPFYAFLVVFSLSLSAGCDLLDPTGVENPGVLESEFVSFSEPVAAWLRGMNRDLAIALDEIIVPAEIASDNYTNTQTFFNQFMDRLEFDYKDVDVEQALREVAQLREEAEFGLNQAIHVDPDVTPAQVAELHFYRGLSLLMTGEYFHLAPVDSAGPPMPAAQQFALAVEALQQAIETATDEQRRVGYRIVLARTYRMLGDRVNARQQTEESIAIDPDYLRFAGYDNQNGPRSDIQDALYDRATFDDLQPLPRLDFLDPKFFRGAKPTPSDDDDTDVAFIKGEEAYLILAEVQLAEGDLAGAQETMRHLLELVARRPRTDLADVDEGRTQSRPGSRPDDPAWEVAFSPADSFRTGLVVSRTEPVAFPVVSGTHLTTADLDRIESEEAALEMLYLLRQEIFIAEGRRMVDLGLRWPVSEREVMSNPNISDGDPSTEGVVPDFLPPGAEIDAFTLDADQKQVTLLHNLNRILVQNRTSDLVLPFFRPAL